MNVVWERFFFIATWLLLGPSFLHPTSYAKMHRMHHLHSDTEKDPHSPHFFRNVFQMMLRTKKLFVEIRSDIKGEVSEIAMYFKDHTTPEWKSFTRFANGRVSLILMALFYAYLYYLISPGPWYWVLLPITWASGPIHGAIVNWCGHKYGRRNFNTPDRSRNTWFAWIFWAELYQNNHHEDEHNPNFARKWFEFDPAYQMIRLFSFMKIIRLKKKKV